ELIHHTRADGTPYDSIDSPIRKSLNNLATVRVSNEIFWRKDGTSFPVEYVARPQIDSQSPESDGGKPLGVVVAFTDTTERRALDRMKDEFISTVSHELRTPLTSLRGALGLLAGGALGDLSDEAREVVEIAERNCGRLIGLVNDILDLERLEAGRMEMRIEEQSLDAILKRSV